MFNLAESNQSGDDSEKIMAFFKTLTNNQFNEETIIESHKLGRFKPDAEHVRPIVVKFDCLASKSAVMKKVFRIPMLDRDLAKVRIRHDLTPDQRSELSSLLS